MCLLTTYRHKLCNCIAWRKKTLCLPPLLDEDVECDELYTQTEFCVRKCIRHLDSPPPMRHVPLTSSISANITSDSFKSDDSGDTVFSNTAPNTLTPTTSFSSCNLDDHDHYLPLNFWFSDPRDPSNLAILDSLIKKKFEEKLEAATELKRRAKEIRRTERRLCGLSVFFPPETNDVPLVALIENIRLQERKHEEILEQRLNRKALLPPTPEEPLFSPTIIDKNDVILGTTFHRERGGFTETRIQKWRGFEIENKSLGSKKIDDNVVWNWKFGRWVSREKMDSEMDRQENLRLEFERQYFGF